MHIIYVVQVFLFGVVKDDQSSIVLQALLLLQKNLFGRFACFLIFNFFLVF